MTATNLARFKKIFEDQLDQLSKKLEPKSRELSLNADDLIDGTDYGTAKVEQAMALRLLERKTKFMSKIVAALKRIGEGRFGVCMGCGEEIALRRLEVRPMSSCCIKCQETRDRVPRCFTPFSDVLAYQRIWASEAVDLLDCYA